MTCDIRMTADQARDIQQCEYLVVREYCRADGSRFAKPVAWGDEEEMKIQATIRGIFVVPVGLSIVGQTAIPVAQLFDEGGVR